MADRPILFSAPMILALIAGRKVQTRRTLKPQPFPVGGPFYRPSPTVAPREWHSVSASGHIANIQKVRVAPGDRLWVKETHAIVPRTAYRMSDGVQQTLKPGDNHDAAVYAAGWERSKPGRWRPSIHMPRWASRLTLIVTDVRVERLQDISEEDAIAEGVEATEFWREEHPASIVYSVLWENINGDGTWERNPFVVVYTFDVHHGNIDQMGRVAA